MKVLNKLLPLFAIAALAFASAHVQAGKVYLWYTTDASGKKIPNYGEKPPQGVSATLISDSGSAKSKDANAVAGKDESKTDSPDQAEPKAKKPSLSPQMIAECENERGRLRTLQSSSSRLRMEDENGQLRYLTPAEIAEEISRSQAFLDQTCSP